MISHKHASLLAFLCASLWCAVAAAQSAPPAGKLLPAPPSTGREMPKKERPDLSQQQAVALVGEAMKLSARESECAKVTMLLERALPYATTLPKADGIKALRTLQRCAIKSKRWKAVMLATAGLVQLAPEQASPDELVRAMVELGQYDRAAATLKTLVKQLPKAAHELSAAATLLFCRQELWATCAKTGKAALAALEKEGAAPDGEAMLKTACSTPRR